MIPSPEEFRTLVYKRYRECGREFHWRTFADNPYYVLVSEIMLQQTQTHRVAPKYEAFIERFPDFPSLATSPLLDVLRLWQGLGYNRRAKALRECAIAVLERFGGILPQDEKELRSLPGIGPYTAGALQAFAFKIPSVFIETNIRSVYLHHYFPDVEAVPDREILPLIAGTLDLSNPRAWYYALMDYGVLLKSQGLGHNGRSAHYKKQSRFEGSKRQVRGAIVRALAKEGSLTLEGLREMSNGNTQYLEVSLLDLEREQLIVQEAGRYRVRE